MITPIAIAIPSFSIYFIKINVYKAFVTLSFSQKITIIIWPHNTLACLFWLNLFYDEYGINGVSRLPRIYFFLTE
jgi:hypothetical protein